MMRAICIASGKGGTSKSTLTAALGALLTKDADQLELEKRPRVAIVDLNLDQATLSRWWTERGRPVFPHLVKLTNFAADIAVLRATKFNVCLIDTPPDEMDIIETAIIEADATLIPVRPSDLDLGACKAVVDLCRRRRKPFGFILTQVDNRPMYQAINEAAAATLRTMGRVLAVTFPARKAYVASVADPKLRGKTGHEIDKTLEPVLQAIWAEVETIGVKTAEPKVKGAANA
jgi:cellulose biosynthesis protein BcsQ